jgi:hypothetical protein
VDRALRRSMVDQRQQTRSSPEEGHAGVPVRRTSPWQCGELEEGMGILSLGGTRWWRVSDGRAFAKGGGGGASSMRRCSGREGDGRRRVTSAVWRAGGGGAFYTLGEEGRWSGEGGRRSGEGGRLSAAIEVGRGLHASITTLEGVVGEGKRRQCEAARLHTLRTEVWGHDTVAARLGRQWRRCWEIEVGDEAQVGQTGPRRLM